MNSRHNIGVDIGGTFTDLIYVDEQSGEVRIDKIPTTLDDRARGFLSGIGGLGVDIGDIDWLVHGTTAGTNAVLERNGAPVGLITTLGFRDVLELGRRTRPHNYGLHGEFIPLVPRFRRLEVEERIDAKGNVLVPLDEDGVRAVAKELLSLGAETLAIHFMNSYVNTDHEQRCYEIVRDIWPNDNIVVGHKVMREVREFERGTTAAIQASIQPIVSEYIGRVSEQLKEAGFKRELLIMQGNGGMMAAKVVPEKAVHTVMSGPAAGVLAAAATATAAGFPNAITGDVGGTSFDVALIVNGKPIISSERDIAYGVPIRVPMTDIHTIGSGGGSIAHVDKAGMLRVGPESAGSYPGPIGFGRGGNRPTVTDANFYLGRLNPDSVTGSVEKADLDKISKGLADHIGSQLGLSPLEAASAILAIANHDMAEAIRLVSIERGFDPRDFALVPFGGAGPVHAVSLARVIGIPTVLVPRYPGITSALGCILADVRHDFVNTVNVPLRECSSIEMDAVLVSQIESANDLLEREAVELTDITFQHEADLFYRGQSHTMRIEVQSPGFDPKHIEKVFAEVYHKRFEISLPEMVPMIMNLRTTVTGRRPHVDLRVLAQGAGTSLGGAKVGTRKAYFDGKWEHCDVYRRELLPIGSVFSGPAIVEQTDTTVVIDPGAAVEVDAFANLKIDVAPKG